MAFAMSQFLEWKCADTCSMLMLMCFSFNLKRIQWLLVWVEDDWRHYLFLFRTRITIHHCIMDLFKFCLLLSALSIPFRWRKDIQICFKSCDLSNRNRLPRPLASGLACKSSLRGVAEVWGRPTELAIFWWWELGTEEDHYESVPSISYEETWKDHNVNNLLSAECFFAADMNSDLLIFVYICHNYSSCIWKLIFLQLRNSRTDFDRQNLRICGHGQALGERPDRCDLVSVLPNGPLVQRLGLAHRRTWPQKWHDLTLLHCYMAIL